MIRLCLFVLLAHVGTSVVAADAIDLKYRSYRKWTINLPAAAWFKVNDGIKIPHANGDRFAAEVDGNTIRFDTDGDGELDRTIKPLVDRDSNVSTARVVLSGKTAEGREFRYAARLRKDALGWGGARQPIRDAKLSQFRLPSASLGGWKWAPGGAMTGAITTAAGPIPIRIIDQNGNGSFNDIGVDAMIVGSGDEATFLSQTVVIDNKLRQLDVAADGTRLSMTDYTGPTTTFDMTTSFNAKAVLLSAIIRSEDGKHSFDFGALDGPMEIPAGNYKFVAGTVGLGEHRVQIGAGEMKPFKLAANQKQTHTWGGPVRSDFTFVRAGDKVQFSPQTVWYYGKAGEEYFNWAPCGKSPEFKVTNAETGAVIEVAILPGSC